MTHSGLGPRNIRQLLGRLKATAGTDNPLFVDKETARR